MTQAQQLAFVAFLLFAALAILSSGGTVSPSRLDEVRKLTLFTVGALLPSDALVRYGRTLLFATVDDARRAADVVPATTRAQWLAFGAFLVVWLLALAPHDVIDTQSLAQVDEVARVLIVALLPSDAGIRFGRGLYLRGKGGQPTDEQLKRV